MAENGDATLDRREVAKEFLNARGDVLLVTGLGSATYDAGTNDSKNTFYLWGGMGAAAMMGLGLALAQPSRQVVVMTGDGEMLMGMGAFATIGAKQPKNLNIVVIDNGHYSETGMQPTHVSKGVSLPGIAKACGFVECATIKTGEELTSTLPRIMSGLNGPGFFDIKVTTRRYPLSMRMRDGAYIKDRFRENLLGQSAFD